MPGHIWNRPTIIDDLADRECLRDLYVAEVLAIAKETGQQFVPDQNFEDAVTRAVTRYADMLQMRAGQRGIGGDGAISAVRGLYRILHEEYVEPVFEADPHAAPTDEFAARLLTISPRAFAAYSFCWRFLLIVGWFHYGIEPVDNDLADADALAEAAVRSFETNPNYSFEQLRSRTLTHGRTV